MIIRFKNHLKYSTSFHDLKNFQKSGYGGDLIKALHYKLRANIILNGEKEKFFSCQMNNKTRIPTLNTSIQHSPESPSQSNEASK